MSVSARSEPQDRQCPAPAGSSMMRAAPWSPVPSVTSSKQKRSASGTTPDNLPIRRRTLATGAPSVCSLTASTTLWVMESSCISTSRGRLHPWLHRMPRCQLMDVSATFEQAVVRVRRDVGIQALKDVGVEAHRRRCNRNTYIVRAGAQIHAGARRRNANTPHNANPTALAAPWVATSQVNDRCGSCAASPSA